MSQSNPSPIFRFSLFLFAALSISYLINAQNDHQLKTCRGMFVFGSSLVDNGNNNVLPNSSWPAKADYLPYGVDFPLGPSGRFTNGKNVIDVLSEKLGLPHFVPPFSDPGTKGCRIVHGVDFASGGSGILDNTGSIAGNVTSMNQQIINFENVTLPELEKELGRNRSEILAEFLFVVGTGGNDYSLNYFLGWAKSYVSLEDFTANLTTSLSHQLKRLYDLGARKYVLMGMQPNGCAPMARSSAPTGAGCVEILNKAAQMFNANLKNLVDDIRLEMPCANLVLVNAYKIITDIITDPGSEGFRYVNSSCCQVPQRSEGGTGVSCKKGGSTCVNRSEYVFFDGLHPTEAVNVVIGSKAFASDLKDEVFPFNISQLSQM